MEPRCENCWEDAYGMSRYTGKGQNACYQELVKMREKNPCTPKKHAGQFWDEKKQCDIVTISIVNYREGCKAWTPYCPMNRILQAALKSASIIFPQAHL